MNDDPLASVLASLKATPSPALPHDFNRRVWAAIRSRTAPTGLLDEFFEAVFRPAFASAAVGVVLLIAFGSAAMTSRPAAGPALGLDVFSHAAPSLPATLLSQT